MKYRVKKETKPTLPTFGKYKAVAVHEQTVGEETLLSDIVSRSHVDKGDAKGVLIALSETINHYLRKGYRVRLPELGLLKLEIESEKVDAPEDFRPKKHIRGVRLHFIAESNNKSQPLYAGLTFEKDKNVYKE
jgi:predicted histone-like DNA-binding protein